jgi:hypothetical protein
MDFRENEGRTVPLQAADSGQLSGINLSLQDVLVRIPALDGLYKMTFGTDSLTTVMQIDTPRTCSNCYRIQVQIHEGFSDLNSLKRIVDGLRERFPVLRIWRLESAQYAWGETTIWFENLPIGDLNEFSREYATCADGTYRHEPKDEVRRLALKECLSPTAGYVQGGIYMTAPVQDAYISEFSLQYLALFLLSSLVRYRPQIWAHAIAKSAFGDKPVDDRMLSLVEKFLQVNRNSIPELIVQVLNPGEDFYATRYKVEAD